MWSHVEMHTPTDTRAEIITKETHRINLYIYIWRCIHTHAFICLIVQNADPLNQILVQHSWLHTHTVCFVCVGLHHVFSYSSYCSFARYCNCFITICVRIGLRFWLFWMSSDFPPFPKPFSPLTDAAISCAPFLYIRNVFFSWNHLSFSSRVPKRSGRLHLVASFMLIYHIDWLINLHAVLWVDELRKANNYICCCVYIYIYIDIDI